MGFEKKRKLWNTGVKAALYAASGLTAALLVFLIGYIFWRGVPYLTWELLSSQTSYIRNTIGILPNILNTVYIILVAMVIYFVLIVALRAISRDDLALMPKGDKLARLLRL